jgi:type I restriction enzyme, S subunit
VSISDLTSKVVCDTKEEITDYAVTKTRCRKVPKGTLLFSFKLTIGKMAFAGCDLYTNEAIAALHIKDKGELHGDYLFYALQVAKLLGSNQAVMGKTLNSKSLAKIEIPVPEEIDDQKRIAHLLGKVEGLIDRRKQHLQQLDDLLKSVFLEMFGDPVRNEKGWNRKPLSELATVRIGPFGSLLHAEDYITGGIPLINPSHIVNGEIVIDESLTITEEKFQELSAYHMALNDVVVARRGEIGRCALVRNKTKLLCGTGSMFVRVTGEYLPIMLQFMIYRTTLKDYLESNAKGVTMKNLNSSILEKMQVIVPPPDLQNHFAAIVEKVEGLKSRYQQSLTDLENLYGALSQKAFKGELDLSRVVLPAEGPDTAEEVKTEVEEKQPMEPLFELPAPDELALLQTAEGRKSLLGEWLNAWLEQLGDGHFTAQAFMEAARQRLWELAEEEGLNHEEGKHESFIEWIYESLEWGKVEYDELKSLVFDALEQGRLTQGYDDANNCVRITVAKG